MNDLRHRDQTEAVALRIAYENLLRLGWKFTPDKIGEDARAIINALDTPKPSIPKPSY